MLLLCILTQEIFSVSKEYAVAMPNYDRFSKHYDAVMGDPKKKAVFLKSLIRKWHPEARTLLELAFGTGAVLRHFAPDFKVSGLDSPTAKTAKIFFVCQS